MCVFDELEYNVTRNGSSSKALYMLKLCDDYFIWQKFNACITSLNIRACNSISHCEILRVMMGEDCPKSIIKLILNL